MKRVVRILQVEDSPEDRMMMTEALGESSASIELHSVATTREATALISGESQWQPDVVLLDLSLPGDTGFGVLQFIKRRKDLRSLAVIIFSSSKAEKDIQKAYDLQANCYIPKPADFDGYLALVVSLKDFLTRWVQLPSAK